MGEMIFRKMYTPPFISNVYWFSSFDHFSQCETSCKALKSEHSSFLLHTSDLFYLGDQRYNIKAMDVLGSLRIFLFYFAELLNTIWDMKKNPGPRR